MSDNNDLSRLLEALSHSLGQSQLALKQITKNEKPLPVGMRHEIEHLGPESLSSNGGIHIQIVVVNMVGDTITNNGTNTGNMGRDNTAAATGAVTTTINSAPAELEGLLRPFAEALANSTLSKGQQTTLQGQLETLREEGAKKPEERDGNLIKSTLGNITAAISAVTALKGVWDAAGPTVTAWFSGA